MLRHLMKKEKVDLSEIPANSILIADDLDPSLTAMLDLTKVIGFVTNEGGKTSHTSILARAHNIPAVVGTHKATDIIHNGDPVIVDSNTGKVIVNPDAATLKLYKTARNVYEQHRHSLEQIAHLEAITRDNRRIHLAGNIEIPDEADTIIKNGGFGIGLYRTEFFYMNRNSLPSEDELFETFRDVLEKMHPAPVVFRTIDLGGDKFSDTFLEHKNEANPFLGWRAIRFCLENRSIFIAQLRAILRASAFGNAKIMIPMITDVSEIIETKKIIADIMKDLDNHGIGYDKRIPLGAMIEIPAAALTSNSIAREVNFFSVGSNDLVQYTLAVDRNNSKIAHLFDPFHPAVIHLLKITIDSAKRNNISVSICGELGSDPMAIPLLVGLGFDELSVSPSVIPDVKRVIRNMEFAYAQKIADKILQMDNSVEIQKYLKTVVDVFAPEVVTRKR
jgi:phosphotransferase system enzyme I (PtsI)